MQDMKVRGTWVHFPVGATRFVFWFFHDSVESIESKANYGKTRLNTPHVSF